MDRIINHAAEYDLSGIAMPLIVVCINPVDYPGRYTARLYQGEKGKAQNQVMVKDTLEEVQEELEKLGLVPVLREENDPPVVMEVWI